MISAARWLSEWSIFGRGSLVIRVRIAREDFSVEALAVAFVRQGARIERHGATSLDCALPVRKFVRMVGYPRKLDLSCAMEIARGSSDGDLELSLVCILENLRKANRFLFYFLSVFVFALVVGNLTGGWDVTMFLMQLIPWAIVEGNFIVDRGRLRAKLLKILESVQGVRAAFGDVAESR